MLVMGFREGTTTLKVGTRKQRISYIAPHLHPTFLVVALQRSMLTCDVWCL